MGSEYPQYRSFQASTIAIIGAGPSGLVAAKYLIAEGAFTKVVIFEQRSHLGGLWIQTPYDEEASRALQVPQTNPHVDAEEPMHTKDGDVFTSPVYDRLETNIPRSLMKFTDLDWPQECQLFPSHQSVLKYIEEYGAEVKHLIRFSTQVLDVRRISTSSSYEVKGEEKVSSIWSVTTRDLQSRVQAEHTFDAVIVANGHFNVPFIPIVPNIEAWKQRFPGSITHSKFFRRPEDFAGKKVVVVGNSASGLDIAAQIRQYCRKPLIQSLRSESQFLSEPSADLIEKTPIIEYKPESRTLVFEDGSTESDVDSVLYCTGYLYSLPYLKSLDPPLITTGERVENLYQHIFYQPDPTLSFLTLNQKVIPFPVAEAQSAIIARVLAYRLPLPSVAAMREHEKKELLRCDKIKDFHVLKFPADANYINRLHYWAMSTFSEKHAGKRPPHWDQEAYWTRERFPAIKKAFQAFGEERHSKRTLKDVGFDYAEWREQNQPV